MYCPYCGKIIPTGVRFCPSCGRKLPVHFSASQSGAQEKHATPTDAAHAASGSQTVPQQASSAKPEPAGKAQHTSTNGPASAPTMGQTPLASQTSPTGSKPGVPPVPPAQAGVAGRPASNFPAEFMASKAWSSIFIALACGIGSAAVLALIGATIVAVVSENMSDGVNIGFFTAFIAFLIHACAGSLSVSGMEATLSLPLGLASLALLLGTAFGAFLTARKTGMRFKPVGIVSSAIAGTISAVFFLLIGFIPLRVEGSGASAFDSAIPDVRGASARTFFCALFITVVGALAGYALAAAEPLARNVFSAFHRWTRTSRGWVRVLAEGIVVPGTVLVVLSLVLAVIALCAMNTDGDTKGEIALIAFALLPTVLVDLSSLIMGGGVEATGSAEGLFGVLGQGSSTSDISLWTTHDSTSAGTWILILFFVIFLVALLYTGCREAARNAYDPAYAGWGETWQAPLFTLVGGLFVTLLFCNLSGGGSLFGFSASGSIRPALWVPLLLAAWTFLVEVVGITFGRGIVGSLPQMWRFFLPGTVAGLSAEKASADVRALAAKRAARAAVYRSQAPVVPAATPAPAPPSVSTPTRGNQAASSPTQPLPLSPATALSVPTRPPLKRERKPMSKKAKRILITLGSVAAALIVLGAAYTVLCNTVFNPSHQVEDYLQAIEDGDFEKASSLVNPGVSTRQGKLLTNQAGKSISQSLRNDVAFIHDARVEQVSDGANGSKTARVSYTLNGSRQSKSVQIVHDGTSGLIFPKWRVSTPMVTTIGVSTSAGGGSYTINGISLSSANAAHEGQDGGYEFYVYPGKYTVSVPHSKYLTTDSSKEVTSGSQTSFDLKPADVLQKDIVAQVRSKLDACVSQSTVSPSNCDFNIGVDNDDSDLQTQNVEWAVTSYPDVSQVSLGSSDDEGGDNSSTSSPKNITGSFTLSDGSVKLTYQDRYDDDDDWDNENQDFDISGTGSFTINGDKLTVSVSNDESDSF